MDKIIEFEMNHEDNAGRHKQKREEKKDRKRANPSFSPTSAVCQEVTVPTIRCQTSSDIIL
jgi:hypothetical protein